MARSCRVWRSCRRRYRSNPIEASTGSSGCTARPRAEPAQGGAASGPAQGAARRRDMLAARGAGQAKHLAKRVWPGRACRRARTASAAAAAGHAVHAGRVGSPPASPLIVPLNSWVRRSSTSMRPLPLPNQQRWPAGRLAGRGQSARAPREGLRARQARGALGCAVQRTVACTGASCGTDRLLHDVQDVSTGFSRQAHRRALAQGR